MKSEKINSILSRCLANFKPPESLTVSEWADKYRRLSRETSAEAGQWRTSRTPYLKEIMDAFCDPKLRSIILVSSSQTGKSECINNMIGYVIDQDPSSILFIHPTNGEAEDYSKLRIAPMIRDSKVLKSKVADPKSRDSANTIRQKAYPGGILTMIGSTEAHALASKPIRYIFCDEMDRFAKTTSEGDPVMLAKARQITFFNSKFVGVSTPTIKGNSTIEDLYNTGTMERWKTKCPHCGEYNEISFDHIRFEKEETVVNRKKNIKLTSVYYICPSCGSVSTEKEMKRQPSKWVSTNPDAYQNNKTRSFWLTSWVSPWASWESTILEYLYAIGSTKDMQVVYNTRFGQLWENRGDVEDEDSVMSRREEYSAELPDGVLCLTCGMDTQDDRLEYEVVGHGHFGETWGIKKGIIMGRPDSPDVWKSVDELLDHVFYFGDGKSMKLSLTFIDEGGHFTQEIRARCRERQSKRIYPVKGRGGENIPYTSPPKKYEVNIGGKGLVQVFEIGVDSGKAVIMDNLRVQTPGAKYCHFPKRDDYGEAYFKGLLSEHLVYKKENKNKWVWEKIPGHERNEALDCRNYANAAVKVLSPDFDSIEARLRGNVPQKTVVKRPVKRPARKKTNYYNEW